MVDLIKSLPQNKEAEQAVLGSILLDEQAINLALEEITANDFLFNIPKSVLTFPKKS